MNITTNMGEFTASLERYIKRLGDSLDVVAQESVEEIGHRIIARTPVDEDEEDPVHIKGDWVAGIGALPSDEQRNDKTGNGAKQDITEKAKKWYPSKGGASFYIANYRPYGIMLEYGLYPNPPEGGANKTVDGFSTQAPQGMVGISVLEWDSIVDDKARKYGR